MIGLLCRISSLLYDSFAKETCNLKEPTKLDIGWRGVIGCFISMGHFPQKSPIISGSLAKNDLQLKAPYGVFATL